MALQLHPAATLVAQASARLIEEVANLQAGRHTRCQLSTGLSSNSAKPWKDSSAKRARRHSMPAECAQPLSVHSCALPKGITLVAVDEAGALAAGELAIFLCHIASHLAPGCPALSSHSHSHSPLQLERF